MPIVGACFVGAMLACTDPLDGVLDEEPIAVVEERTIDGTAVFFQAQCVRASSHDDSQSRWCGASQEEDVVSVWYIEGGCLKMRTTSKPVFEGVPIFIAEDYPFVQAKVEQVLSRGELEVTHGGWIGATVRSQEAHIAERCQAPLDTWVYWYATGG